MSYLTPRDEVVLDCLTRRLPWLSFEQLVRLGWPESVSSRAARKRVKFLISTRLLQRRIANVPAIHAQRIAAWRPDQGRPDLDRVFQQTQGLLMRPAAPVEFFEASKLAANCFGVMPWQVKDYPSRVSAYLLADVCVQFRRTLPTVSLVVSRDHSGIGANALLFDDQNNVCGRIYSALASAIWQLEKMHDHCVAAALPYELWGAIR